MNDKKSLQDYTESEFLEFVRQFFKAAAPSTDYEQSDTENEVQALDAIDASEKHFDELVDHFRAITEHPSGSDLIYYPEDHVEDSPEGILNEVKKWRAANGKPGFKPA
ncbi:bacteriocin immunity protein [Pseudomonas cremoricolorata]|uniref:bacteriocin immunity protein n=1 Tax=Pseudomonas cremoricolorata TaxID=157783 RepID=UPI0003FF45F7|nr:bacteriocin immunity protein [Pseudomonas cremoricolorata]